MLVYKPPFFPAREDDLVVATLETHIGPEDQPRDSVASPNWPFKAPGRRGMVNAASPKYAGNLESLYAIEPKPLILWIRGSHDLAVSDTAASCPGWPGLPDRSPAGRTPKSSRPSPCLARLGPCWIVIGQPTVP